MHLLCENGADHNEWYVLSASADAKALQDRADQLNRADYEREHAAWVARGKTGGMPLQLDDPRRNGFARYYVGAVPDWPDGAPRLESQEDRRMQRCKTCTHWQPEQAADGEPLRGLLGSGVCGKAPQIWDVTDDVENPDGWSTHKVLKPEHAAILAVVEDGSAYTATLITMPDFGCVQHQTK